MRKQATTTGEGGGNANSAHAVPPTASKKKFGKNLNRLVKPAAPPIVDRSLGSSRNGLLLLSSKNRNSGSGGSGNAAPLSSSLTGSIATLGTTGGGLLSKSTSSSATSAAGSGSIAATTAPIIPATTTAVPPASVAAPVGTTTHARLLSVVQGAGPAASVPPDAWGVAASASAVAGPSKDEQRFTDVHLPSAVPEDRRSVPQPSEEPHHLPPAPSGPAWDEYGGREPPSRGLATYDDGGYDDHHHHNNDDDEPQAARMSRLARERAEHKRLEEQSRLEEQRDRAKQRLRELEEKRESGVAITTTTTSATPPRRHGWDLTRSGSRELWEPGDQNPAASRPHRGGREVASPTGNGHPPGGNRGASPYAGAQPPPPTASYAAAGPVIQLSSYEDRDRGEQPRGSGAAPRMLFDPKSGSLVAVKARDEWGGTETTGQSSSATANNHHSNQNGANKKGRTRKGRKETSAASDAVSADHVRLVRKPPSSRADGLLGDSPRGDEGHRGPSSLSTPRAAGLSSGAGAGAIQLPPRRRTLPRTCGVLYRRDNQGHCYCADDCDGDLGYGAHSVPGGRTKNPQAYTSFVEQHRLQYKNGATAGASLYGGGAGSLVGYGAAGGPYGDVGLKTGFRTEEEDEEAEEELVPEPIEFVRGDKLELVTGLDDSPSLKPTAKEWAPSQAALAAARAVAEQTSRSIAAESSEDEDGLDLDGVVEGVVEDDDDDDDGPLGLGFDPTLDMDFVMQSPSHDDEAKRVESLAISDLALEPPAFSQNEPSSGPRHIFAFGTSGTWGVGHPSSALTGHSDWKVSGMSDVSGLFGAGGAFRVDDSKVLAGSATSLLNIPTSSSWASLPTSGLAGLTSTMGETTATATTTTTPGD